MINAFEMFCNLKGLYINVGKTKAMQINMDERFKCGNVENIYCFLLNFITYKRVLNI